MKTEWIHYFGYGSLVNRQTRPVGEVAHAARLHGWRRVWQHRVADPYRGQPCTSLSIEPDDGPASAIEQGASMAIDGVIVRLPVSELPQLDAREAGYDRLGLSLDQFSLSDALARQLEQEGTRQIMVYRSQMQNRIMADERHPVLMSYVDCVLAGYLQRFGTEGVHDMIASTRGWELSFLDDRAEPFYPRAVAVSEADRRWFDRSIAARLPGEHWRRLA